MRELQAEKTLVQTEAREALIESGGRGLVSIATGGGKSKIAIDYMRIKEIALDKELSTLIVVPTKKLRDRDWYNEFLEWSTESHYNRVDKFCYASVNKIKNKHYDIVILDEVQNITPNNAEFFFENNNRYTDIIALSGTPPHEKEKVEIMDSLGLQLVYHVPLDEAVERGIVAPYELILVEFNLDNRNKNVKAGSKKKYWMTTEEKQYEYLTKRIDKARINGVNYDRLKFMRLDRMRFIYNLRSKKAVGKYMLDKIIPQDERTLIFAGSIAMAEELEPKTFHSKTNDDDFNDFVTGKINKLSAVQALNEGVNIPNLDNALIVQVNTKERHLIQKIGRIVRYRPGHRAKIYLCYAKGTVDEDWMLKATENITISNTLKLKI